MDNEIKEDEIVYFSNEDGKDDNPGTIEKPVSTLQRAKELCDVKNKRSILDKDRIGENRRLIVAGG